MPGLSFDQVKFVQTLANLSYGSGRNEGTSGGKGNMGVFYDNDGKMHVIKYNTHFSQERDAQIAVNANARSELSQSLLKASNNLRQELIKIGMSAGMSTSALNRVLQGFDDSPNLLTRKVVANFVTEVKTSLQNQRPDPDGPNMDTHALDSVWKDVRATKSSLSMSLESVKRSTVAGHNKTVFTKDQLVLRDARDLLNDPRVCGCQFVNLSALAQKIDRQLAKSLANETTDQGLLNLAKNLKGNLEKAGLNWMLSSDQEKHCAPAIEALKRVPTDGNPPTKDVLAGFDTQMFKKHMVGFMMRTGLKNDLSQNFETMITTGKPTFAELVAKNAALIQKRAVYEIGVGENQVFFAIKPKFGGIYTDVAKYVSGPIWEKIESDWGNEMIKSMVKTGTPKFTEIVRAAIDELDTPLRNDGVMPVNDITLILRDELIDKTKGESDVLAAKLWNDFLSKSFAENFKTMMKTGEPNFVTLVKETFAANRDALMGGDGITAWDKINAAVNSDTQLSTGDKKKILDNVKCMRELASKKDEIIAAIKAAFERAQKNANDTGLPPPNWNGFLSTNQIQRILRRLNLNYASDLVWHEGANSTDDLIDMIKTFATFTEIFAKAEEKNELHGLFLAMTDTGCAQSRLDAIIAYVA